MIYWLLHGFVAAIFLRAGIGKLIGRSDFYWQLRASAIFHRRLVSAFSYAVPLLELCAGVGILIPAIGGPWAEILAAAMLTVFTSYSFWITATGRKVQCFCFGHNDGAIGWPTVLRNSLLLGALALAAASPVGRLPEEAVLLSVVNGLTASLLFVGAFQMVSMQKELVQP